MRLIRLPSIAFLSAERIDDKYISAIAELLAWAHDLKRGGERQRNTLIEKADADSSKNKQATDENFCSRFFTSIKETQDDIQTKTEKKQKEWIQEFDLGDRGWGVPRGRLHLTTDWSGVCQFLRTDTLEEDLRSNR